MSLPDPTAMNELDWHEQRQRLLQYIEIGDRQQQEARQRKMAHELAQQLHRIFVPSPVGEEPAPAPPVHDVTPPCAPTNDPSLSSNSSNQTSASPDLSAVTSEATDADYEDADEVEQDESDDDYIADTSGNDAISGSDWESDPVLDTDSTGVHAFVDYTDDILHSQGSDQEPASDASGAELDLPEYMDEPLLPLEENQLQQDQQVLIKYHGRLQPLQDHLNIKLLGSEGLARCVEEHGSRAVCSPEQSDKTVALAGIGLVSYRKHKPSVAMVCDKKNNTKTVSDALQVLLRPYGIEVRYMSGNRPWKEAATSPIALDAFREGRLMLVMSTHAAEIENLNIFLSAHNVSGLTLSIDESDNVWTSYIADASSTSELQLRSKREVAMYRLLGSLLPNSCKQPLQRGSRVRSLIQVSATHVNTIHWHQMWRLPFRALMADRELLEARGYATEKDMCHARTLDAGMLTLKNNYAIDSEEVVAEFETFKEDQRPGRLMMVCLTPYVNKDMAMTSFAMAHRVLDSHCPDAICLVVHGRGVNAILKDPRHPEWARDQGTIVYDRADAERLTKIQQAGFAIQIMDEKYGLTRPIVVIGYNCIGRCTSIRSKQRVINYIIAGYQKGRTCADLKQMLMRGAGGGTRAVRQLQGYQHIRTVCTKEDWDVLQTLYDFTQEALQLAATGQVEDLAKWTCADYNIRYLTLVQTKRPMVRRTMGRLDFSHALFNGRPQPQAVGLDGSRHSSEEQHGLVMGAAEAGDENERPQKRHKTVYNKDALWYRLMHCIWEVCKRERSADVFRKDLLAYCDSNREYASIREELVTGHNHAFHQITSARHLVKTVQDKSKSWHLIKLLDKGQEFCADEFSGVLVQDEF